MNQSELIESAQDFPKNPAGEQRRWGVEIKAARDWFRVFQEKGEKVVDRFLDEERSGNGPESHLNLFWSNVITVRALLYGKIPRVDVDRRFTDPEDDEARVGGEMLERLLNSDIERDDDNYTLALTYALEDWTLPGLGQCRVRYEVETSETEGTEAILDESGAEMAPAIPPQTVKSWEEAQVDYVQWKDFLYSPCRAWSEVRWVAFRAEMTRDQLKDRFGEDLGKKVPMRSKMPEVPVAERAEGSVEDAWMRAEVWEIWCKEDRKVYWWASGMDIILDAKDDPLGLQGFFPCPKPLTTNTTTRKFIPKADFQLGQDLYNEIDELTTRIRLLESSVRVTGGYDAANVELGQMVTATAENKLIPIRNFASWMEKGGMAGAVAWFPIEPIVKAIEILSAKRQEKIALLFQVTGMSDIMRGQGVQPATATEQRIKAGFSSTRIQTKQDELARFATDVQKLRAEIISLHFDPQTIVDRSNVLRTADAQMAQQAVQFIKSDFFRYRLQVRPESISLPDTAQLKQEGVEFLGAFSQFMGSIQGSNPAMLPFLLEVLKWTMSRFKGAATMEGVIDRAISQFTQMLQQQAQQPPPPDPKMMAAIADAKAKMQQTQMDAQVSQMETQQKMALGQMEMRNKVMQNQLDLKKLQAQAQAEVLKERTGAGMQGLPPEGRV
jgi:hypothetical protein